MIQSPRVLYVSGFLIRLALFGFTSVIDTLSQRVELTTPVTSFKRLTEGVFLYNSSIPPYDGGVFHQSPLLLCLFSFITVYVPYFIPLIYAALDLSIAYALSLITELKQKRPSPNLKDETFISPHTVAALYLFNPFSILSCASRSTLLFTNLSVILATLSILKDRTRRAMFWSAMAVYLSLYPAMLLPGFLLFTKKKSLCIGLFICFLSLLFGFSRLIVGSWDFVESTYGTILFLSDLTPNVGLFWYFFIELFDQFRSFFMLVFQFHAFIFTLPVCIKFSHQPLFAVAILCGIMGIFKSYPSISDTTLYLGLLSTHYEIVPYCRQKFLIFNLFAYGSVLSPIFWHLWIYAGSGNANFFYAITLVYNFAQIFLLIECVYGALRREFDINHPEAIGKPVVQK
ncbi:GPI transamidase component [Sporodiniella umbellata]|nr:GPI transamidase component [Sporodiniella umbellata]